MSINLNYAELIAANARASQVIVPPVVHTTGYPKVTWQKVENSTDVKQDGRPEQQHQLPRCKINEKQQQQQQHQT